MRLKVAIVQRVAIPMAEYVGLLVNPTGRDAHVSLPPPLRTAMGLWHISGTPTPPRALSFLH